MTDRFETIAAIATASGRGGIGIVRASGPAVPQIAESLCGGLPQPRHAVLRKFLDANQQTIDQGLALYFSAPNSFTGEHVLELHAHGGSVVLGLLLARVVELGARLARPGEFSERAFLNDKLDLVQAEAVADLIDATTTQAAQAAMRSLQGEFSRRVNELLHELVELRVYVEAALDFPEEEIDFLSDARIVVGLNDLEQGFSKLEAATRQGCLLRDGLNVVIAGRPNAGKSSLMNCLAGSDRAIVTNIPGTTRDLLQEHIAIEGIPMHLTDTAGLCESTDTVEQEGVRRAWQAISKADQVLLVIDDQIGMQEEDRDILAGLPQGMSCTVVYNKIDVTGRTPGPVAGKPLEMALSAKAGAGVNVLRTHLAHSSGHQEATAGDFTARRRHQDALLRSHDHVNTGRRRLEQDRAGELLAEELRLAQMAMNEITGELSNDDLLGKIFSSFCIGK